MDHKDQIITKDQSVKEALQKLNSQGGFIRILFVVDDKNRMVGTLSDGDIRRGLLEREDLSIPVSDVMHGNFKYLQQNNFNVEYIKSLKQKGINLVPLLNEDYEILKVFDLSTKNSILPLDAVIMAGGEGKRLRPLTENTPKPLLHVGDKPILEQNIDRLNEKFGVYTFYLTVKYLGEQIRDYFKDGSDKGISICYHWENDKALGTIGSLSCFDHFPHDYILVMNSDILTTLDFEDFFQDFIQKDADMAVATIPYRVQIPYGVLETDHHQIFDLKEKPTYTYYSNGGIYLIKKRIIEEIPKNEFFNATDLMEKLIMNGGKVTNYPVLGYWLDIGKKEDYDKAQEDIQHLSF